MPLRWLPLFPLLYAAAFLAVVQELHDTESLEPFMIWQRILVRVLGALGCFVAVSCFERGDHMRRAWFWLGTGTVVILVRNVLRLSPAFDPQNGTPAVQALMAGLGVLANLALLAGIWMLARSWKMASITLPGGRSGVAAVALVTAALALLVVGPGALQHFRALLQGDWSALLPVVSAVVDILSLCLITPLLLTAVSMRGGLFSWPLALVTASQISWLLNDFAGALKPGVLPPGLHLAELARGLAENFLFVAGIAQYLVIRQVRRRAAVPRSTEPTPQAVASSP